MTATCPRFPRLEINFPFKGERWITRLGNIGQPIEIVLDGHLHQIAAQLTSRLPRGVKLQTIRAAVFGGPFAILLDRIIAIKTRAKKSAG